MRETRDLNVSAKPTQFQGDSSNPTISENSISGKTVPGTNHNSFQNDIKVNPTALPVETDASFNR